jgi:hypothetical protein
MDMHHQEKTPVQVVSLCSTTHPGSYRKSLCYLHLVTTTHVTLQTTLLPIFITIHILLTPHIIFASIFLHKKCLVQSLVSRINGSIAVYRQGTNSDVETSTKSNQIAA